MLLSALGTVFMCAADMHMPVFVQYLQECLLKPMLSGFIVCLYV